MILECVVCGSEIEFNLNDLKCFCYCDVCDVKMKVKERQVKGKIILYTEVFDEYSEIEREF